MFKISLSQQVKDGLSMLTNCDTVIDDRFNKILQFCHDSMSANNNEDTIQFIDTAKEEFMSMATSLNCFYVELVKYGTPESEMMEILHELGFATSTTTGGIDRHKQIVNSFREIEANIKQQLGLLAAPELSNDETIVDCEWIQSYIIPNTVSFDQSSVTGVVTDADKLASSNDNLMIAHNQLVYHIKLKLNTGRFIRIKCDEANLQDFVYTLRGCCKQMDNLRA